MISTSTPIDVIEEENEIRLEALRKEWIPRELDDDKEEEVLASFVDIKKKTMRDLYGVGGNDKSPKGSVDVLIQPLVDLLNLHPSFATLSSCSGRIALFDPNQQESSATLTSCSGRIALFDRNLQQESSTSDEYLSLLDSKDTEKDDKPLGEDELLKNLGLPNSGKGIGGWLLASHTIVEPSVLVKLLDEPTRGESHDTTLILKHEPLLLHVAASSLTRGRQLLSLALQLGFRESGLVVSQHRVTVAIRGHSLALCVPIARHGSLRPGNDYLSSLVKEANKRMQLNQEKLERLYQTIQENMFHRVIPKHLAVTLESLAPLNLWGHAAVAIPVGAEGDVGVLVFGGYGEGPDIVGEQKGKKKCSRSNRVYCLRRRKRTFEDKWREIAQPTLSAEHRMKRITSSMGVSAFPVDFTPREGLDACLLPTKKSAERPVVALWGGRASPAKPFNDLLLYDFEPSLGPVFLKPVDIRGMQPEARWGHSFTALSGKDGLMAVLVGGRNETKTFGSLYILKLVEGDSKSKNHFQWAKLDLGLPAQFHHSTVVENDSIFVFGGHSSTDELLESFRKDKHSCIFGFNVDSQGVAILKDADVGNESFDGMGSLIGGASSVVHVVETSGEKKETLIALTGGVPSRAYSKSSDPIQWCEIMTTEEDDLVMEPRRDIKMETTTADFGSMVHHRCVPLPSFPECAELLLIGGGVSSFAFGPSFAGYVFCC